MELLLINIYNCVVKAYSQPGIMHHGANNESIYRVTALIPMPAVTWLKYSFKTASTRAEALKNLTQRCRKGEICYVIAPKTETWGM